MMVVFLMSVIMLDNHKGEEKKKYFASQSVFFFSFLNNLNQITLVSFFIKVT